MNSTPAPDATELADLAAHPAVNRVRQALHSLGADARITVLDSHARTAVLAAQYLGIEVGAIANSLVFAVPRPDAEPRPLLVMASGAHRCDTALLAAELGVPEVNRATPEFVRAATGFAIGGVAPVGHPTAIDTLVDIDLAGYEQIWAAGGHPRTVFATTFEELLRLTGGRAVQVA